MKSKGVEFSSLFDPDIMGDGPTAPGYTANGVPIRFAHIKYGTKRADVGYAENGVDVSNKWAAFGTAVYQTVAFIAGLSVNIPNGWTGLANQAYRLTLNADGTGSKGRGPSLPATIFDWTSDGNPPLKDYEVRLSAVNILDAGGGAWSFTNNTGGVWVPLDSTHGENIATLTFVPNFNNGQGNFEADATLEVREKLTGTIVKTSGMTITGTAANA